MLIPIVPEQAVRDNAAWIQRAFAACGSLAFDLTASPSNPPIFKGRKTIAGPFTDLEAAGEYLNAGVAEVYVLAEEVNLQQFVDAYPPARIVARTKLEDEISTVYEQGKITSFQLVVSVREISTWTEVAKRILTKCPKCKLALVISESFTSDNEVKEVEQVVGALHRLVEDRPVHVVCPIAEGSIQEQPPIDLVSPARCLLKSLAPSDRPDGLIATVVTDERGIALGMVYSNEMSVMTSIGCGRGVYWSRSRKSLWRKGESSGAVQYLVSISTDCDQDALRFCVVQTGEPPAFCHTGARTCWGADGGISHLFRTLQDRKKSAPAGSYTARLYGDMNLLRNKLLEEADELAEAVKGCSEGKDSVVHVEEETADVLYFALTACVAGGGNLDAVEHQLDKRSFAVKRRKGDAKQSRIDETESRLKEIAASKKLKEGSA